MIRTNNIRLYLAAGIILLLLSYCANPVTPVGGPQDTTPPSVEKAEPPLLSINFSVTKVRIWFDEFVEFKDLNQQVIISPPMNKKPEFKIKGKSVTIEFQEELKDSTTYNIFFGNAIVDVTESNPISNFQYVFSTGSVLDSLTFKGNVTDAFTLEPIPDLNVGLYLDNNDTLPFDSLPYYVKPYYYSKTTESGDFQFNNLMNKDFKLFVLEDGNSSMIFDQVSERIAFLDSLIHPYYIPPPVEADTTADSTTLAIDTSALIIETIATIIDTIATIIDTTNTYDEPNPVKLRLFQEVDSVQRFIKASLVKPGKIMFVFKQTTMSPEIIPLNIPEDLDWRITEANLTKDTISIWIKEKVPDTLSFVIADRGEILDTVEISILEKKKSKKIKNADKEIKREKLIVKFGKKTELNTTQKVRFAYPLKEYDLSGSLLVENEDTLSPVFQIADSIGLVGEFTHEWKENSNYHFLIPDSAFFSLGGLSHDTLLHNMKTKAISDYGNLYIDVFLTAPGTNHIIQLIKKDQILEELIITADTRVSFEYLLPDDYRVKIMIDHNNNRKWDTGHYIKKIQPEPVYFFPNIITVRANWDIVEEWTVGDSGGF